jgi:hypothetical protein
MTEEETPELVEGDAPKAPEIPIPEGIDAVVEQFVRLRDALKKAEDEHKKRTSAAKQHLDRLSGALLTKLQDIGGESVKTAHGTVYRSTRRSASIVDGDAFRKYVIGHAAFDLVDWKANAPVVDDFIKSNQAPPPGVNFSVAYTVGVRRK